jgi:D-threo-aldose 1-dehydrogenase
MNPTETTSLGGTGLRVTRLGLGTAPLGGLYEPVAEADAEAVVHRAYELGLRFFDTAPLYGHGLSERRLGRALQRHPRGSYVVATKVGRLLQRGAPGDLNGDVIFKGIPADVKPVFDFSADGVMRSHRESLERLGLDRVDVLHIHDPDEHFDEALGQAYPALDDLRAGGTIGAVGAGMNQPEMPARLARAARFDCFLLAGRYTLLDQAGLTELLPLCREEGISIIIGGVFNSGILADPRPGSTYSYAPAPPGTLARARRMQSVCAAHGVPLAAAAIQFPFGHPAVASVVVGARSASELEEDVAMFRQPIPPALWDDLKSEGLLPADVPVPAGVPGGEA